MHKTLKKLHQMIAFDLIFHLVHIFIHFVHVVSFKIDVKNIFLHFLVIFELFKFQKGLIFGIFILDLALKWLLDALNIHFIYFE